MWTVHPLAAMRLRLPNKSNDYLWHVLWNCTAYPFNRPYKALRQAVYFEECKKQGISVCFCCGDPYKMDRIYIDELCEKCRVMHG